MNNLRDLFLGTPVQRLPPDGNKPHEIDQLVAAFRKVVNDTRHGYIETCSGIMCQLI
jgi:hypothetical protein